MLRKVTKIWTMKDGSKIRICDMSDEHLQNCVTLLEKKARQEEVSRLLSFPNFNGEMAQYYGEQQFDELLEQEISPYDISPLYENLLKEVERRKSLRA